MAALDQLAGGEWFEIRERLHRPEQLFEFFSSGDRPAARVAALTEACSAAASGLDAAIEGGIFEFRRAELGAILSELAEAEYSSEVFSRLGVMEARAAALILATACQRALLTQDLPFGGVGHSGMGRYGGFAGFKTFSNARSVAHPPKIDLMAMEPPFTAKMVKTLRSLIKS